MKDGFTGGKPGFGWGFSAQKILYRGRLSREDRVNIVSGTSFSGGIALGPGIAGQMSPTENGNYYSIGSSIGEGFNFTLGGGQSFQPSGFGSPLRLPLSWGSPHP